MKSTRYFFTKQRAAVFLFITLMASSCKKLIEIPANPASLIPQATVFADSAAAMGAMAGIYNNFNVTGPLTIHSGAITLNTGLSGDELVPSSPGDAFYDNNILPNDGVSASMWSYAYTALYQVNACLEGIPASNGISAGLKQQLIGEAKVVRALYYFNLVNLYGPVPLVLSTDYHETMVLPRAPIETVYQQIIRDLGDAREALDETYPSAGRARPNRYVAEALLAKVYLYREQWDQAVTAANDVISSGFYGLANDLNDVFLSGSNEAIWQLPANGQSFQTAEASAFIPTRDGRNAATDLVPRYPLTPGLLAAFPAQDLRKQKWLGMTSVPGPNGNASYYYPYKYKNRAVAATPAEDYMIIRLAELYLIRAEALAHQGKVAEAVADLNMIRNPDRVGMAAYAGAQDPAVVLAAILQERRLELFCEWGNRWYDLKRTNQINEALEAVKTGWDPTDSLYPVPLQEIQRNPFLNQNPGYH